MKISIVTATFNSSATLCDTLDSVLSQSYRDVEHIIVDGLSSDGTVDLVRSYIERYEACGKTLRYISEKDHGIYDAMNKGISLATGEIVGMLNSDDIYHDSSVLTHIADMMSRNSLDAVYGDLEFVDCSDINKCVRFWKGSQHYSGAFLKGWHPAHPTFYARKECYDRFGGFDTSFDVSADFELMLRFIERNSISNAYIPHTLVKMRMGGESTGSVKKIIQGNKNVLRAFEKNGFKVPPFYLVRRLVPKAINMIKTKLHL